MRVDWTLVINLTFLLLLLFAARRAWLDRSSNKTLDRRGTKRQITFFAAAAVAFALKWMPIDVNQSVLTIVGSLFVIVGLLWVGPDRKPRWQRLNDGDPIDDE